MSCSKPLCSLDIRSFLGLAGYYRRFLEILKDYDMSVLYHPRKANVVEDTLSQLSMGSVAHIEEAKKEFVQDLHRLARSGGLLWNGMKKDIAEFVTKCANFQQVKVQYQKLGGLSQEISIPTWKWEDVNMDFIIGLPRTRRQHDSIWVIVDRMSKSANFLLFKVSYWTEEYAKLYLREMAKLELNVRVNVKKEGLDPRKTGKDPRLHMNWPRHCLHPHEHLHDPWWQPRPVVPPVEG
ncbi:hypothetical protein MTR67_012211 [Solanum verrucosum]|uniref:Uncharacterized protein n=1 Tax=Solanum verrucosum TaxID=315347 RepID=A0AAF0Q8H9_SOLVR|nr:hypothetical protein MTR67_012211 [Solanum verrucosum]